MNDFIGDRRCVTHHHACDCREAHFRELEAENKRLKEENRWMPVSEPPNNVLEVWVIGRGLIQTGRYINGKWCRIGYGGGTLTNITHWKPIILPDQALKDKQ